MFQDKFPPETKRDSFLFARAPEDDSDGRVLELFVRVFGEDDQIIPICNREIGPLLVYESNSFALITWQVDASLIIEPCLMAYARRLAKIGKGTEQVL